MMIMIMMRMKNTKQTILPTKISSIDKAHKKLRKKMEILEKIQKSVKIQKSGKFVINTLLSIS